MKYYIKFTLITISLLALLTGCSSSREDNTSTEIDIDETTQTFEESQTETVSFFATGRYEVGVDIQPGAYYIVLTDMQYSASDEKQQAYVSISIRDSREDSKYSESFIKEVGKPYRVTLEEGDRISFDDTYSPAGWNINFFTLEDYKEYQSSGKK